MRKSYESLGFDFCLECIAAEPLAFAVRSSLGSPEGLVGRSTLRYIISLTLVYVVLFSLSSRPCSRSHVCPVSRLVFRRLSNFVVRRIPLHGILRARVIRDLKIPRGEFRTSLLLHLRIASGRLSVQITTLACAHKSQRLALRPRVEDALSRDNTGEVMSSPDARTRERALGLSSATWLVSLSCIQSTDLPN